MPSVIIANLNNIELICNEINKKVIDIFHDNSIDWMHACGKKGRCTTCKMIVLKGMDGLSPLTKFEIQYRKAGRLANDERLSCQAQLSGDIVVEVPESSKLPHMFYS